MRHMKLFPSITAPREELQVLRRSEDCLARCSASSVGANSLQGINQFCLGVDVGKPNPSPAQVKP